MRVHNVHSRELPAPAERWPTSPIGFDRSLYRVLIKAHDALVEDLLDNAKRAVGGRPLPSLPLPRLVRVANAVEGGFVRLAA